MLMVFANKQDIEGAMTPSEISTALGLSALKNRTWSIFKTSAIKGEGLEEAMEWWGLSYVHLYEFIILMTYVDNDCVIFMFKLLLSFVIESLELCIVPQVASVC